MEQALHRLVYYSRNRITGSPERIQEEIARILACSQKNNSAIGITGALMFNAGCFAQVLEGKREVVESTFERIQLNEGHGDVSLLAFEPIEARMFGQWSMGFVGAKADDAARFADVAKKSGFDPATASGEEILDRLQALALEKEAESV